MNIISEGVKKELFTFSLLSMGVSVNELAGDGM